MARTIALGELRAMSADLADEQNSGVIPTETWNRWINQAYGKLYDKLVESGGDFSIRQQTLTTMLASDPAATSDPSVYLLPGDFLWIRGLDVNLGGNQFTTMHKFNWNDRNQYKLWGTTGWFAGLPLKYRLVDKTMMFAPIPSGSFVVTLWYYPGPPLLESDEQMVDVLSGGDLFISFFVAAMATLRQESFDLSDRLFAKADVELERIVAMASSRDATEPERVTEIYRRGRGRRTDWGI